MTYLTLGYFLRDDTMSATTGWLSWSKAGRLASCLLILLAIIGTSEIISVAEAQGIESENLELVDQFGGAIETVAIVGDYAYLGVGPA